MTLGPSSADTNHPVGLCPTPSPLSKGGSRAQKETRSDPNALFALEILPTPDPNPLSGSESKAHERSRVQEARWEVECLSSQGQRGGNSSCQESKLPRVQPRAGSGTQDAGWEPGMEGGPGRQPRAMAVPRTSGSAATVATPQLQLSHRVAGERLGEGEGSGEGRGGAWLLVPCACAERRRALGSALRWIGPGRPPAPVLTTAASRRRCEGSSAARWPLLGPLRPSARCWPLAGRNFRRAAGSDEARPNRPEARHLGAPCPGPDRPAPPGSAPSSRRTRLLTKHRARSPRPSFWSRRRGSSPRSTFPRFLRPARPPPPRPRLLTLPPSPPASPSPCPPRRAPLPTLPPRWAPGSLSPLPLTPLGPPGAARSRGQALRA